MTPEERLGEMRHRIVRARRRDLMQTIAVEVMEEEGDYSLIPQLFEERWVEPTTDELDQQVATKIASGMEWMEQELGTLQAAGARVPEKVEKFRALLEQADASSDNSEAMDQLRRDLDEFRQLQTYLAVEPTPPSGASRAARAGVAEIKAREGED